MTHLDSILKSALEKTPESPLDCKDIQPVHPKGDQSWVFIGRTDVEAEAPNTWATWCDELTHLKRPWSWEDWWPKEKGTTEDEMVGWHHWFNGHKFEKPPGVGDGQGSLVCYSPCGRKKLDLLSDWTELKKEWWTLQFYAKQSRCQQHKALSVLLWPKRSQEFTLGYLNISPDSDPIDQNRPKDSILWKSSDKGNPRGNEMTLPYIIMSFFMSIPI